MSRFSFILCTYVLVCFGALSCTDEPPYPTQSTDLEPSETHAGEPHIGDSPAARPDVKVPSEAEGPQADGSAELGEDSLDESRFERSDLNADKRAPTTVGEVVDAFACSTAPTQPLNAQIAAEINCVRSGFFERIDDIPNVRLGPAANSFLQSNAARALRTTAASNPNAFFDINSSWRSVVQQYILYQWQGTCGISIAALPGTSNHESGLALDVPLGTTFAFRSPLLRSGWSWFCDRTNGGSTRSCRDIPHHDFFSGRDLRSLGVLAFQRLWNRANPNDLISEDGSYGPQTATRLRRAPLAGFSSGTTCGTSFTQPEEDPCPPTFSDTPRSNPFWSAIEGGYRAGIWAGCQGGEDPLFCPDDTLTREQAAVVITRAMGLPAPPAEGAFTDVPYERWSASAIEALWRAEITSGCQSDPLAFCPQERVTRAMMIVWLVKALGLPINTGVGRFSDLPAAHWAAPYAEAAARANITQGCAADRFCPDQPLTRAQMAALVSNAFDIPAPPACPAE